MAEPSEPVDAGLTRDRPPELAGRRREPARRYHLLILGAGSAGLAAASFAAATGARVALVGHSELGGVRRRYAVPAAELIRASRLGRRGEGAFAAAVARARDRRAAVAPEAEAARLRALGVDVFLGDGRFVAGDAVDVAGRRLRFRRALIATGARTLPPAVAGIESAGCLTPETIFDLTAPPGRLAILGAGARGCELAQAFAAFGSEVHLIDDAARVLPRWEADAAALIADALEHAGVRLHLASEVLDVQRRGAQREIVLAPGGSKMTVDAVLLTTRRAASVAGLGLEAAGVEYDLSGIEVDRRLRTTRRNILAVGDVLAPPGRAHAAEAEAHAAVRNALFFRRLGRRHAAPRVVFTSPQVAQVGLGEEDLTKAPRSRISTVTVPSADLLRSADGDPVDGGPGGSFLRLRLRRRSGKILGALLVAERAAESIVPVALAVTRGIALEAFAEGLPRFSVDGEVYRRAARLWRRQTRQPVAGSLLDLWFRLT